jgi:hypothetical protein
VSEETWRPLGVDGQDEVAKYDALHDGVPAWMVPPFWTWIRAGISVNSRFPDGSGLFPMLDVVLAEEMAQTLRITLPNLRTGERNPRAGANQLQSAMEALTKHSQPLQIADYLLAHGENAKAGILDALLERSKSAWEVGTRVGRPGLVRRVPLGVQVAADAIMARAGRAGVRLAKAWEELYALEPNAGAAYGLAIKAVEDAAIPEVSPTNGSATLGTVLKQLEDQGDWKLPMEREHDRAPSHDVVVGMLRMLWHGQHDRHGGQPSAPGDVSIEEATVAVSLAVTLVNLFDAGVVRRDK